MCPFNKCGNWDLDRSGDCPAAFHSRFVWSKAWACCTTWPTALLEQGHKQSWWTGETSLTDQLFMIYSYISIASFILHEPEFLWPFTPHSIENQWIFSWTANGKSNISGLQNPFLDEILQESLPFLANQNEVTSSSDQARPLAVWCGTIGQSCLRLGSSWRGYGAPSITNLLCVFGQITRALWASVSPPAHGADVSCIGFVIQLKYNDNGILRVLWNWTHSQEYSKKGEKMKFTCPWAHSLLFFR